MRILLTNDDGVYAPGLRAMRKELQTLGEVTVVAPAGEQSAVGHSITLLTPLITQEVLDENQQAMGYAVEGRPADCVKLALLELLKEPPDLIVSGLNAGSNAGINVLYSGTVAAAVEGSFFQCTSIAVSLVTNKPKPPNFPLAAEHARRVVEQLIRHPLARGSLFNVNIPNFDKTPIKGIRVVPQNIAPYQEKYDRRIDPRGRLYFWSGPDFGCLDPHPDTDETALCEGYITITPLHFNLTHTGMLAKMRDWEWTV
ncbi:MAG: 5'/3'-nucleotidase SurE [Planctomycetes bacterium]|nr:5'/3'-nucleotidase SurE [Planctomycetota bacterium]